MPAEILNSARLNRNGAINGRPAATLGLDKWQTSTSPGHDSQTVGLVRRLCEALDAERIDYCHWKSNDALAKSADGRNDLDLLVRREHGDRFDQLLRRLGFKQAFAPREHGMPGVLDYYGLDQETGRLIHAHVHYQLVVGDDWTKNYCLPLAEAMLTSTAVAHGFRVPRPEVEFVVFVIRMLIKHATWDVIWTRKGRLSRAERDELAWLRSRVDVGQAAAAVRDDLPALDARLFEQCVQSLEAVGSTWFRPRTARRLLKVLEAYTRRPYHSNLALKMTRRIKQAVGRRLRLRPAKRRLATGGAMIAFVGGDGAGKSTTVEAIHSWLGRECDVRRLHLGKPKWSWTTHCVRALLKLGRCVGLSPYVDASAVLYPAPGTPPQVPNLALFIRELCTARDRYRAYLRARHFVNDGGIVISDRFPLPQVKLMDGPLIARLYGDTRAETRLVAILRKWEESYYRAMAHPDVLFILKLDPSIAVERKPEESPEFVHTRSSEIWQLDELEIRAHSVDTSRPKEYVFAEIRNTIWSKI